MIRDRVCRYINQIYVTWSGEILTSKKMFLGRKATIKTMTQKHL